MFNYYNQMAALRKNQGSNSGFASAQALAVGNNWQEPQITDDAVKCVENAQKDTINPFIRAGQPHQVSSQTEVSIERREEANNHVQPYRIWPIINPFIHLAFDDRSSTVTNPEDDMSSVSASPASDEIAEKPQSVQIPEEITVRPKTITAQYGQTFELLNMFSNASAQPPVNNAEPASEEGKKPKVKPFRIMQAFALKYRACNINGELFVCEKRHYERKGKEDAKTLISTFCRAVVGDDVTTRLVSEVFGLLRSYGAITNNNAMIDDTLIDTLDGIFDVKKGCIVPFEAAMMCFHYLPYHVSPALVGEYLCPNFTRFLNNITGGVPALVQRAWELTTALIMPKRIKNMPTLIGPPSSGKSVYISLIKKLHAHGDCFPLTFDRLTDRFSLSYAAAANVITYYDIPNKRLKPTEAAVLKSLCSTEDDLAVETKGGAVKNLSQSRLKVLLASNFIVRGYTRDEAFDERITYFPFPYSVPKEKRAENLSEILARESDVIISTCLFKYAQKLIETNFAFSGEEEVEELMEQMTSYAPEDETGTLLDFVGDRIEDAPGLKVSTAELFEEFVKYCGGFLIFPTDRKFSEAFAKAIGERASKCRLPVNGKSVNGYRGICLKPANP